MSTEPAQYWISAVLRTHPVNIPVLQQALASYPVLGIEEWDDGCQVYFDKDAWESCAEQILKVAADGSATLSLACMLPQNWNAIWESSFEPIIIEDHCRIRASFHATSMEGILDIEIQPEMAFGTGHHATTVMMIKAMRRMDLAPLSILDYGSGSGVLSIYAAKRGASGIDALDYDIHSYQSTQTNAVRNQCSHITAYHGEIKVLEKSSYDLILANIHRHVLLEQTPRLRQMILPKGYLLLSGILWEDRQLITDSLATHDWSIVRTELTDGWLCILARAL